MLVANSFDLWQKDAFFTAAEEVQQSADIMESAYRTWLRGRREGLIPQQVDELSRQLQMSLGTAKWQLDEFQRAVRMSYRGHGDDITVNRHKQFVSAMEEQISDVETALKEAYEMDGKKPFRWVHLDEQECDDLALFLSGTSMTTRVTNNDTSGKTSFDQSMHTKEDSKQGECFEEVVNRSEDAKCFAEQNEIEVPEIGTEITYEDMFLEIVIDKDDRHKNAPVEATPKEKGSKPSFWRAKGASNHTQMKVMNWMNQCLGSHRNQRQQNVSPVSPVKSIRFILVLMLTVFLVVPFLVYSS